MRVIQKALTFDDVLLLPAHSRVLPREVSLKTRLTRQLELNIPVVSAAMDTVTLASWLWSPPAFSNIGVYGSKALVGAGAKNLSASKKSGWTLKGPIKAISAEMQ